MDEYQLFNWIRPCTEFGILRGRYEFEFAISTTSARELDLVDIHYRVDVHLLCKPMAMLFQVWSPLLANDKVWYALNTTLCGIPPKKFCSTAIFEQFHEEVQNISLEDLRAENGGRVSVKWFNGGNKSKNDVFVGTTFAVLIGSIRRKDPRELDFLKSQRFAEVKAKLNTLNFAASARPGSDSAIFSDSVIRDNESCNRLQLQNIALQNQLASCAKELMALRKQIAVVFKQNELRNTDTESPPTLFTSSPPKSPPTSCSTPTPRSLSPSSESGSMSSTSTPKSRSRMSIDDIESSLDYAPATKRRKIRDKAFEVFNELNEVAELHGEKLESILSRCCVLERGNSISGVKDMLGKTIEAVSVDRGVVKAFNDLIPSEVWQKRLKEMQVPDWMLLLSKLESRLSDDGWQNVLNRTKLGKSGKATDTGLLLTKNSIKALRSMIFQKVQELFEIIPVPDEDIPGFQVGLRSIIVWQARELRLHGLLTQKLQLNLKLDGRPFFGRSQVLVGVVPLVSPNGSNQSCKSVYPVALANCKEDRESLTKLLFDLNRQKDFIKKEGVSVDGVQISVSFKVTLDLKALYLLLVKKDDVNFCLAKKGMAVEFCFFCLAIRNCSCNLGPHSVCLEHFITTKANIGGFTGIRDDLTFLMEEELTAINLCALHCELRNTEQLLGSLGLFSYQIGALEECNKELKKYGPENSPNRLSVKLKQGQQTGVNKQNISMTSFSGNTERQFLNNIESIVRESLPHEKLKAFFRGEPDPDITRQALLNKIAFCEKRIKYYEKLIKSNVFKRDYGTRQEEMTLAGSEVAKNIEELLVTWKAKQEELEFNCEKLFPSLKKLSAAKKKQMAENLKDGQLEYVAEMTHHFYLKVFEGWRDIAAIIRDKIFKEEEEHLIDTFDVQCKEWGFLLREMFGNRLGTGDYGHMTVEHISMLMRTFRSMKDYSNQGFEATHSLQRLLFSKATSHDRHGHTSSICQMLKHFYAEKLLFMRLCFTMALECAEKGKPFYFRGCGWSTQHAVAWTKDDVTWMSAINKLFEGLFGGDFLEYETEKGTKVVKVSPGSIPVYEYDHEQWEIGINEYLKKLAQEDPVVTPLPPQSQPPSSQGPSQQPSTSHGPSQPPSSQGPSQQPSTSHGPSQPPSSQGPSQQPSTSHGPPQPPSSQGPSQQPSTSHGPSQPPSSQGTSQQPSSLHVHVPQPPVKVYSDLKKCMSHQATRRQLASLILPPVKPISVKDLQLSVNPLRLSNPLSLGVRPSEVIIEKCFTLLNNAIDDDEDDVGVCITSLGTFNACSLGIWRRACTAATLKYKVREEVKWLDQNSRDLPPQAIAAIKSILLEYKPNQEVLREGDFFIDVEDFGSLTCERWLTGFTIDVVCLFYGRSGGNKESNIYLPSVVQTWAATGDLAFLCTKLQPFLDKWYSKETRWVLTPLHINGNHWGLLCLDVKSKHISYDDGLRMNPPGNTNVIIQTLLKALHHLLDNSSSSFIMSKWDISLPLRRFGMPTQPTYGIGSGGCGVGVILSARDLLLSKFPAFSWDFSEMVGHRQHLLWQIVQWKERT